MKEIIEQFKEIGNETINLIYSKTKEQKDLHCKKLQEKIVNLDPKLITLIK